MTRLLTIPLAFLMALPLAAEDPKPQNAAGTAATKTAAPAPAPAPAADSPMVQAMKRANRLGRKPGRVITNETVLASKGHVTTTTTQRPLEVPEPQLSPNELAEQNLVRTREEAAKARELSLEKEKKAAEERERRIAASAARAEEGLYEEVDDDPAQTERAAEQAHEKTDEKPPGKQ